MKFKTGDKVKIKVEDNKTEWPHWYKGNKHAIFTVYDTDEGDTVIRIKEIVDTDGGGYRWRWLHSDIIPINVDYLPEELFTL